MRRRLLVGLSFCLLAPSALAAQRRGGGSPWGYTPQHRVFLGSHPILPLYSHYPYNYGFGMPWYGGYSYPGYGYFPDPPRGSDGPAYVIAAAPEIPLEKRVVYIPTYLRPDPGPSLGEIARALRAKRKRE